MLKFFARFFAALFRREVVAPRSTSPPTPPARPPSTPPPPQAPPPHRTARQIQDELTALVQEAGAWVVFEPNTQATRELLVQRVFDLLLARWQAGDLRGNKPEQAFFVRCDATTMTQDDLDNGRLICLVGFAILRPAEFEIVRIGWTTADGDP